MKCKECEYEAEDMYDMAEHAAYVHQNLIEVKLAYDGIFDIRELFDEE
jgi:hypothetical protein